MNKNRKMRLVENGGAQISSIRGFLHILMYLGFFFNLIISVLTANVDFHAETMVPWVKLHECLKIAKCGRCKSWGSNLRRDPQNAANPTTMAFCELHVGKLILGLTYGAM